MTDADKQARLADLECVWRERFMKQPKLPTSALLTGALAMALGFGAVLFLIGTMLSHYAKSWTVACAIFAGSSLACGAVNRLLARRWYSGEVLPWSIDRKALKAEIDALRSEPSKLK